MKSLRVFEVKVIKCGSLQVVATYTLEADHIEEARQTGITRYGRPNHFIGVTAI
jgi:hypothetical protein